MRIGILGAGNMGTALAVHLGGRSHDIRLWCIEPRVEHDINAHRCNDQYLPDVALPKTVRAYPDLKDALDGTDAVIIALPSHAVIRVMDKAASALPPKALVISVSKGFDRATLLPTCLAIRDRLPNANRARFCALAGPAIATELAAKSPTAFCVGADRADIARTAARLFAGETVKAAVSTDLLGCGIAAGLKNAYAIALGMCDGFGHAMNTKALVTTLAIGEMRNIIVRAGGREETAHGLAGIGDLMVTGMSPHGRNRQYGERLASKPHAHLPYAFQTTEGVAAAACGIRLANRYRVETPLLHAVSSCLSAARHDAAPFAAFLRKLTLA